MLNLILIAGAGEAGRNLPAQTDPAIGLAQQQRAGIGGYFIAPPSNEAVT